jgi:hypothetical protein
VNRYLLLHRFVNGLLAIAHPIIFPTLHNLQKNASLHSMLPQDGVKILFRPFNVLSFLVKPVF